MSVELHAEVGVVVDGNWLPDDFPIEGFRDGWKCNHCDSQWMRYRLRGEGWKRDTGRVRLLHKDDGCPCFGKRCECGEASS